MFSISDTDTEVIPHLIEEKLKSHTKMDEAIMNALKEVEGSYALAILTFTSENEIKMYLATKEMPLLVGFNNKKYKALVASEPLTFASLLSTKENNDHNDDDQVYTYQSLSSNYY